MPVYNPLANKKHAVVVSSETASKKAVKAIRNELNQKGGANPTALQFVGFDVEGNLGNRIPALVQIATPSTVYLFRIRYKCSKLGVVIKDAWTPDLHHLLSDPNIVKVGVGVKNDILCLQRTHGDNACGDGGSYLDLAELVKIKWPRVKRFGLRNLTATVLCQRLCKAPKNRDCEREELSDAMTKYAAADAFVSLDLLDVILPESRVLVQEKIEEVNAIKYTLILREKLKKFVSSLRSRVGKYAINQGGKAKIKEATEAKPKATAETKQVKYT